MTRIMINELAEMPRVIFQSTIKTGCMALLASTMLFPAALAAKDVGPTNHLLALAGCPPWKIIDGDPDLTRKMAQSCSSDVQLIVPELQKTMSIDPANTRTVLDAQAHYDNVVSAIKQLASDTGPGDRVVIYVNFHGGVMNSVYRGKASGDEALALYTDSIPANLGDATDDGPWMSMKELRDLIDTINAEEVVVILEACESGGGFDDFRYNLLERYKGGWKGREAVIFSTSAAQAATFTDDNKNGLFTSRLAENLSTGNFENITDAVRQSGIETHRKVRNRCLEEDDVGNGLSFLEDSDGYFEGCTQEPTIYDPFGLLDDMQLDGSSENSTWLKNYANARAAMEKHLKSPDDPFAWTKNIQSDPFAK